MAKRSDRSLVVGLDIGTSKIACLVGEVNEEGEVEVIAVGSHPSHGLKRGVVVDIESTVASIQRAVEEAELMANCQIQSVFAGISGSHIASFNSRGMVPIKDREVTELDVERVLEGGRAVAIPADQQILHVVPQEYSIDNQDGIRQPVGMSGVRLEASVHVVTAAASAVQNLGKCISRCGLRLDQLFLQPLASSHAVLTDDEKDLGVAVVDMGAGTTDVAIFVDGAVRHTSVITIAGDQVTNDVAVAFRTPTNHAEEIKVRYACALTELASSEDHIQVPSVGERPPRRLARHTLAEVVQPRYEEIFDLVRGELQRSGFEEKIIAGIVLTGGASRMEGVVELAEDVFQTNVRLGMPDHVAGLSDVVRSQVYATGVGLLLEGAYAQAQRGQSSSPFSVVSGEGMWERVKSWIRGEF